MVHALKTGSGKTCVLKHLENFTNREWVIIKWYTTTLVYEIGFNCLLLISNQSLSCVNSQVRTCWRLACLEIGACLLALCVF